MKFFIGLDGGGSKTKCVLCDESLNVLAEASAGPSNFLTSGTQKIPSMILNLLVECCSKKDISLSDITSIVLGTTGAGRESDARKLQDSFAELASDKNVAVNSFKVVSDARIALEGAFSGNPGSILIAGTGSIMFGKDKNGNIHRVGGLGRLIGDEGSGLTIGRQGLNLLGKYYDGRIKSTKLKDLIETQFGINNQSTIISKVYSDEFQVQDVAPYVISAAAEGDDECDKILQRETDELLLHILSMNEKLKEEHMKIVFIGGLLSSNNFYSDLLRKKIALYLPSIIIQEPDYPPEIGAVILAKQENLL